MNARPWNLEKRGPWGTTELVVPWPHCYLLQIDGGVVVIAIAVCDLGLEAALGHEDFDLCDALNADITALTRKRDALLGVA